MLKEETEWHNVVLFGRLAESGSSMRRRGTMGIQALCTLAARLRPLCFDDIVGQDNTVRTLRASIHSGCAQSLYCFMGPRGTGKTSLSRILSKCLNCTRGVTTTPCHSCPPCLDIEEGRRVDYVEVDAAANRGVEQMCTLLSGSSYAPVAARHRIYAVDEAHLLTSHALSSMLKTLEEPPAHLKFMLCTTDSAKIPHTVLSRSLALRLSPLTTESLCRMLRRVLRSHGVPFRSSALVPIAAASGGSARDALAMAEGAAAMERGRVLTRDAMCGSESCLALRMLEAIACLDAVGVQAVCSAAIEQCSSPSILLDLMMRSLNAAAWLRCSPGLTPPHGSELRAAARVLRAIGERGAQAMYRTLLYGKRELRFSCSEHIGLSMVALRALAA
ncbi:DNA polymerase III subunit tau [Candidatus Tremblaya princeps]|uniref:DNA polymerase III subunit gamma/tau n=1 Tax=Tremblaya princeps TaxID=189385 RepID=A0A143WPB8_TREPR|nr:DNA polymerase III subunit tau [Candidatus Tremblaya princeps]